MSTTIDSLQIEIKSSSTNAASGIDSLAASLEKLKKNGSFKTVSTNLKHLSDSLNGLPNVHSASNALRTLANSIEKLKGVGSISSISNSLAKLPTALKSVSNIDLTKTKTQLEGVAAAVSPLSSIKAGGLGTMVNAMKNLGKVTESLDDDTIAKFVAKVAKLNDELGPLSNKMTSISDGFKAINANAKTAATSVDKFADEVDTSALNIANFTTIISEAAQAIQGLIDKMAEYIHMASQWDGIEYQFGNTFGEQADMYYEKITEITDALMINKQTFMENAAMAGSMLIGFGVETEDAREMGLGYTELAYDIWAAFNNVYETLDGADGAMAAVRSAIAGEVEPIRRAGFTIVDSQLAITAANHGLEYSSYSATEAQKSYLRYLTLVDQAMSKGIVGTYASEMQTAEGMMRTFSQQLKSLSQEFGSLFLPVLVKIMPWVQAFVELLRDGVYWMANLFGIEIQPVDFSDYKTGADTIDKVANSVGGVTDELDKATESAKALKNATIGIDELNVISPASGSVGSGGSTGTGDGTGNGGYDGVDIGSIWDKAIYEGVQNKVDEIKSKLSSMFDDWLPQLQTIGAALGGWTIAKLLDQFGTAIGKAEKFTGVVNGIKKIAASAIIITLQFKLMEEAFSEFMDGGTILDYIEGVVIGAAGTYLLYKTWGVGGLAIGLGVTAAVSLSTVVEQGGINDMESLTVAITGLVAAIAAFATGWKALVGIWAAIKGSAFVTYIVEFISAVKFAAAEVGWLAALFPKLSTAIVAIGEFLASISAPAWAGIAAAIAAVGSAVYFLAENWDGVVQAAKNWIGLNIIPIFDEFKTTCVALWGALQELWAAIVNVGVSLWNLLPDWLQDTLYGISTSVKEVATAFGEWFSIGAVFEWLGGLVTGILGGVIGGAIAGVLNLVESAVQMITGAVQMLSGILSGFMNLVVGLFTGDFSAALESAELIWEGIQNLFIGAGDAVFGTVGRFVQGIISWFVELWDVLVGHSIVPDTINAIVKWFTSLPSKIFKSVESFVTGIVDKFKGMWSKLVSWWNGKSKLKEYTPSIGSIYDKVKSRWDSARTWWNSKKSAMKTYTPSIGSIYEKVYDRWKNARDWWNKKKGSFKTYTPSIGSLTDKLRSAWNSAKKWWNNNVKLSTKLNIQVPTIKVKWDTAKAFGKEFRYPTGFSLKFAANGGIFDQGSLIWAGERGPEVMATAAGGKTGVMNVQQMQDAVYEGVYSAVVAAMRGQGGGGSQDVHVYLDGREINASVKKHQRESGATLMGNEVYAY